MPNAFKPNGDGKNDVFSIPFNIISNLQSFSIYNRWGQLLFRISNRLQDWDGKSNGLQVDARSYVWSITYLNLQNKNTLVSGSVFVIR